MKKSPYAPEQVGSSLPKVQKAVASRGTAQVPLR